MDLFTIGNYTVSLIDVIVAAVCVLALSLFLFFIIKDIKKNGAKNNDSATDENAASDKTDKKAKKQKRKSSDTVRVDADPVTVILSFDPYAPVDETSCEIAEPYYDEAHETEDMRALREKMRVAREAENKLKELKVRRGKVGYELEKVSRYIRDNKVIISSSQAASEKLKAEYGALTADKKTAKANKQAAGKLKAELDRNVATAEELRGSVEKRTEDEKLLKSAMNYLESEIARTERELTLANTDIERLNETVGAELKKIENDNRARTLMGKYGELKPLLTDANRIYREIIKADGELNDVHAQKHDAKAKLEAAMNELKLSYGAQETELTTRKIGELNRRLIDLDAREEELIAAKEDKLARYAVAKNKANEFLDKEKYELDDIVVAEDKVVGELEYEQLKDEYERKKTEAKTALDAAQKKYDELTERKVKFGKKQQDLKRAYEDEVASALTELRYSRSAYEKAESDCDKVLPSLSPSSLVETGSGVISKERISKKAALDNAERGKIDSARARRAVDALTGTKTAAPFIKDINDEPVKPAAKPVENVTRPMNLPVRPTSEQLRRIMNRLNELERIALREKQQRAVMRGEDYSAAPISKVERKKAQVVAMRKNLKYIDSPQAAKEFKQKLYRLSISLDEDEMSDNVLAEMIRRTMNEATILGERSERGGSKPVNRY